MIKSLLLRLLGGVMVLALLAGGGGYWLYVTGLNAPLPLPEQGGHYTVERGARVIDIARDLIDREWLTYPLAVTWVSAARYRGQARRIKAGEFAVPLGTTPNQLLEIFIRGKAVDYPVTLVEGWNFSQVLAALSKQERLEQTLAGQDPAAIMQALGRPGWHPEGRFFPDTYRVPAGTTDLHVLRMAMEKMEKELAAAWDARGADLPLEDPDQALILASIVEKETGAAEERAQVAGVFTRRLAIGMRLQTDPSVIYGLGEGFDGNLRSADLKKDTPYNTYTRKGLPPTPIAMPGRRALRAAVNPAPGKALYFVANNEGGHAFSASLREHQCAVIRHQLKPHAPRRFRDKCRTHRHCAVCREP